MILRQLLNQDRLKTHRTSKKEITNLFKLIDRDLKDAQITALSNDRRFATAYNAVLQLGTILLYCEGFKPKGIGHHFLIFQTMKEILGKKHHELADYFDSCRAKRNITDYSSSGEISKSETNELIKEASNFKKYVIKWLKENHSQFL